MEGLGGEAGLLGLEQQPALWGKHGDEELDQS